jgi:hypothetical protein
VPDFCRGAAVPLSLYALVPTTFKAAAEQMGGKVARQYWTL